MKFVYSSDWHLRATVPQCAAENLTEWIQIQKDSISQLVEYANEYDCDLIVGGDLFHNAKEVSYLCVSIVQEAAANLRKKLYYIAGNHDMISHSSDNFYNSAVGVLFRSENCTLLNNNFKPDVGAANFDKEPEDKKYVFKHVLCIPSENKNPLIECETPESLALKYKNAKFLFLGDYHKSFIKLVENASGDSCFVINPGCLTIQASDFEDYQPRCVYFNDELETPVIKELSIEVERKYIDNKKTEKKKDQSIDVFVEAVKNNQGITLDYVSNLNKVMQNYDEKVQDTIRSWL